MELNVTPLFSHEEYSADSICNSIMKLGNNAGQITWANALDLADHIRLIKGETAKKDVIDVLVEYGAWTRSEMNKWTMKELNALVFQIITGDMDEAMYSANIKGWRYMSIAELAEVWPSELHIQQIWERSNFPFILITTETGEQQIWYDGFN